jgi:transcriptional regulator GlxA family with amidase domain
MKYAILEYPGCLLSNCAGWRELFALAGRYSGDRARFFESPSDEADLLLVPGCMGTKPEAACLPAVLEALRRAQARGATIAAACSGVLALLAAGIDRGRRVTCHWSLEEELRAAFPRSRVDARELVVDAGDMITAGGVMAWVDLGLHAIGRFLSAEIARECARTIVWDPGRARQSPYADSDAALAPVRPDPALARAALWIEGRIAEPTGVAAWAREAGLGERSLERRWKAAYGKSPVAWIRSARVAMARKLLESGDESWESITAACGYADPSRFRAAFQAETGWSPRRYRTAFRI